MSPGRLFLCRATPCLCLLLLAACDSPTLVVLEDPRTYVEDRSLSQAREDARIRLDIQALFIEDESGRLRDVKVEVYERAVLLVGTVASQGDGLRAGTLAASVDAVGTVYNKIQVTANASLEDAAADLTIETKIKKRLRDADAVSSANMRWHSVNGVVYVFGRALSEEERALALRLMSEVEGVREVVDCLTVRPRGA